MKEKIYKGSVLKTVVELNNGKDIVINEFAGESFDFINKKDKVFVTWKSNSAVVVKS